MKNTILRMLIPAAFTMLLGFVSISAQAQCDPKVGLRDGTKGTTATWCMNELVPFFENSPGYNNNVTWDFGDGTSSTQKNPSKSYSAAGTYTVKFTGTGPAGTCNKDLTVIIEPSPEINVKLLVPDTQCYEGNQFCFVDSSTTVQNSSIVRMTYLFSDGGRIDTLNPVFPVNFCYSFIDQTGGFFDMIIEAEDANGCVSKVTYADYLYVTPKLGIEFVNRTPPPNPGCDSTLGRFENISLIAKRDIASFCWDFGDGTTICGDSINNTEWWDGPNGDGIIEHMYTINGTFNGTLTVTSKFGCTESFTWKAAVTNIVLKPVILSDKDSSCAPDNPVSFWLKDGPPAGASQWLWNFGDPPSGPANFDNQSWEVDHSYGTGPWMISLRIIAGPCDVQVFDTIRKIGPGSAIEVPFVRVDEAQTYQCLITDSVQFVNNSSFYGNDPNPYDEDSLVWEYDFAFRVRFFGSTGFDSLQLLEYNYGDLIKLTNYPINGTINFNGYSVSYDSGKDSLEVTYNGNTTYEAKDFFGVNPKIRYVFNFTENDPPPGTGDQTAIPPAENIRGMNPHVWRVWEFGDQYAPQCTTDSRPWVNKNVGINCNWSIDSLPIHWYTPWDEIYREFNDGNFYRTPVTRTMFERNSRRCFQVAVYPDTMMVNKGDTILTIPYGTFYTHRGVTIGVLEGWPAKEFMKGNWLIRRPPAFYEAPKIYLDDSVFVIYRGTDTVLFDQWVTGRDTIEGSFTSIVTEYDMDVRVPAGVTVKLDKMAAPGGGGAGAGTTRYVTGPTTITIEADEQFTIYDGDSLYPIITIEETANDTDYARTSKFLLADGTTIDSLIIDSAYHREQFFLETAQCFQVQLWHKDTVHPFMCEATSTKSLALIPPNAKGLNIESGIPCPLDGDNLSYYLTFDMGETKPGCTQQWFAVNFDSLADPNNFIPYNQGILAPPPPGSPIPFALPYLIVGNKGTKFVKGYTPGEIGNDPSLRQPNGSFTVGLIVGNGQPDPNGGPPSCLDTAWYSDMFRILYLNADFTIVSPTMERKAICAGDAAYFRINEPIQDSIKTLRWNWGYQGIGRGVNLASYAEQFVYYEEYPGPSPTRNDKDIVYNGEDWLYNYVIRISLSDVFGTQTIDTIVTSIIKDWKVIADKSGADDVVFDLFEAIGLYLPDIPEEDVPLYLGNSAPPYCIDTTGLSQYFKFGIKAYSERVDPLVWRDGDKRYRWTDETMTNFVEVAHILHFRDSSIQGFDSLELDTNLDGKMDMLRGLWKYEYRHPKIVTDPCDKTKKDTIYVPSNGPMIPSLFLNNTVGCEKRGAALLNVGFLNDFWLDNPNICKEKVVNLQDTLRYWQYGDQEWPDDYPIDPTDYWNTPARYLNNIEIYEVDWDSTDGLNDWERSIQQSHIYTDPGTYVITVHSKDSLGCHDTVQVKAYITEVIPGFDISNNFLNCATIVDFIDTTIVNDPCLISADCDDAEPCDSVIRWEWDFGDGTRKSVLQNPSHDYTQGGWFDVTLTVWTVLGCEETITNRIFIPGPQPEFRFDLAVWADGDSAIICVDDSVTLRNISGGEKIDPSWEMRWGDGGVDNPGDSGTLFGHRYDSVGTFYLYMVQFDSIPGTNQRCNRIFPDTNPDLVTQRRIKVIVLPRQDANLEIVDTVLCPDELTDFIAHVDDEYTRYTWDFGDGDTIKRNYPDSVVQHSYASSGVYDVKLIPEYTPSQPFVPVCPDTAYGKVTVVDVFASFSVDSSAKPNYCFINESTGASTYQWTFQDQTADGSSSEVNPCYNWEDRVGDWEVCLTAISAEGCEDDTCLIIPNRFQRKLIIPNVFTPALSGGEGDGLNDWFVVEGSGLEFYEIKIFNRWGERVFTTEMLDSKGNIAEQWNGQINNTGALCPDGSYYYIINYRFKFEEDNEGMGPIEGSVDLIREQ